MKISGLAITVLLTLSSILHNAAAAEFPERQLAAIVPFAAGASNDVIARRISPHLAKALGQQVIIENRPGADGRIGIERWGAAPDGHTIVQRRGGSLDTGPAQNVAWVPCARSSPSPSRESSLRHCRHPNVPRTALSR
jgi:tripartite-type tricarboxylate transporter receptor subunit TctC